MATRRPKRPTHERLSFPLKFPELRYRVNQYTGRSVGDRALRDWFVWCKVSQPHGLYEWSDLAKLVVFGQYLNTFRSYEVAQRKLIEEVESDPGYFFPEIQHIDVEAKSA